MVALGGRGGSACHGWRAVVGLDRACGGESAVLGGFCGQICGRWAPGQYGRSQRRQVRLRSTWRGAPQQLEERRLLAWMGIGDSGGTPGVKES
jgi:hypothetical protein